MRTLAFQMPDRGSGGPTGPRIRVRRPSRRARTLLMTAGVLAVIVMLFVMFAGFWTDWLWYRSVDYSSVFTKTLLTKTAMFVIFGLLMGVAVGLNIWLAHRLRPPLSAMSLEQQNLDRYRMGIAPYKKWILLGVTALVALISGASAASQWRTWLMWINGVPFGQKDPQFGKDVSFYAFDLPWYRFLLSFGFAATVISLIAAALVHYLYGGLRLTSPGSRATAQATSHLSVLIGVFVALKAVAYWLDRYSLAVKSGGFKATEDWTADWTGLRYVDANAYLPAKTILFCIALICAVLFFATLWRRTWQLPVIGFGLMVLSAILIGGVYPALVQQFQVKPNEQAKEAPYIKKNIKATRDAYDIGDSDVKDYSGKSPDSNEELRKAANTTASIRLLDPNVVSPTFQQQQQVRGYYGFPATLDIDRYESKGKEQDTVVGLRELNIQGIPERNWINDHFRYTHGYGMVAGKGTSIGEDGGPDYTERDLPPKGELGKYQPRIYYGEKTSQYSIVGSGKEIDYADDKGEKTYTYKGKSGVNLANPLNRAAYAVTFSEPQFLYSGAIGEGSRILYNRTPKERVEAVAPWLTIDGDPYPAVVKGKVKWIVDAYTTTNGYPYASRTTLGDTTSDSLTQDGQRSVIAQENHVNYIRNSVKATVDAYDGSVEMYTWDEKDPVLKTWKKAFPGTVKAKSEISDELMDHLRYPQDLFKVQRELLTRYHVTSPTQFYSGSERWQVPDDPTNRGNSVPPYYLSLQMPDQKAQKFSLTTTFEPNRRENLGAYMAVVADARSSDYGKIRMLKLPPNSPVYGPSQVQSQFNSNATIADKINILKRGDSEVEYGNQLTVPLRGGLLYVEPVYVRGAGSDFPLLRKVLVTYGKKTAFEDTLGQALDKVFGVKDDGGGDGDGDSDGDTEQPPDSPGSPSVDAALKEAQGAFDRSQKALSKNPPDWDAYGKAQKDLRAALKKAADAEQKAADDQKGNSEKND
ncbi:UPF0182 family protein [Streptomyces sp. NPDC005438]|uniref:UPF0182 family membrane protein n=1 Tax=Streptomyces sp. NPDC005438 TaxID=3156880 RepID=UPI0033AC3859